MGTLKDLYNIGEEIYNQSSYRWDGSSRPILDDYLAPWAKYSNYEEASSLYKKSRHYNNAIRYAKTQLEAAAAQYEQDLAYWNEMDERNYTSQASQKQRYEEAGFNLGYLYNNVDSGNTAVGYNQGAVSIDPNDTSNKSVEQLKNVTEVVSGAFSLATDLVRSGYDIKLIDKRSALATWQSIESANRGEAIALQNKWTKILRQYSPEGNPVDNDFAKSIAFLSEKLNYDLNSKEYSRLSSFVKYCDDLYKNESTNMVKELFQDVDSLIEQVDSTVIQSLLRLLAVMAVSKSQ